METTLLVEDMLEPASMIAAELEGNAYRIIHAAVD